MGDGVRTMPLTGGNWKTRVAEFADSEVFDRLFKEGMALVEEAAAYLDGEGRQQSRALDRADALAYAAESMEVTTRLMQAASWLVVQRAVREKDMSVEEAGEDKFRLTAPSEPRNENIAALPKSLQSLVTRSRALYERVWRLDEKLFSDDVPEGGENPVANQIDRLRNAAENGAFDPLAIWREG